MLVGAVEKSITDSREREAKATKGPYVLHEYNIGWVNVWPECGPNRSHNKCKIASGMKTPDGIFFSDARRMEPRFRDALEVAVAGMEAELRRAGGTIHILKKTLEEISRILSGGGEGGE